MTGDDGDLDLLLVAYVDGELDPAEASGIERRLATDARARQRVKLHQEATGMLRAASAESFYADVPEPLRRSLEPAAPERRRARRRIGWAAAALVLVGALGGALGGFLSGWVAAGAGRAPESESTELIEEILGYHRVYARETEHLVEVQASRRDELATWLGERIGLGRPLVAPDLTGDGFTFAGGRMLVVNDRPVAQLIYTKPDQLPIAVCVTRSGDGGGGGSPATAAAPLLESRSGLDLALWDYDGYTYVVVGAFGGERTREIVTHVAAANARG